MYWGSGMMSLQEVTYATITLEFKGFAVLSPDLVVLHEANMAKATAIIILIFFINIIINLLFDEYANLSMRNRA